MSAGGTEFNTGTVVILVDRQKGNLDGSKSDQN